MATYPDYDHYPDACDIIVPINLKVPICLETVVISKKPICLDKNGHKSTASSDNAETMMQAESQL